MYNSNRYINKEIAMMAGGGDDLSAHERHGGVSVQHAGPLGLLSPFRPNLELYPEYDEALLFSP
jgi:hypothetical protein